METNISNENLNDFHWKNKLEDVDSLPGEILTDKNATWGKLHSRLTQNPRQVKILWYWAAAAALLLILSIPLIMPDIRSGSLAKNTIVNIRSAKSPAPLILSATENKPVVISSSLIDGKKLTKQVIKRKRQYPAKDITYKEEMLTVEPDDQKNVQQEPVISAPMEIRHVETTIAAPVKKKLMVIHNNELGDPVEEDLSTARNNEHRSIRIKLINQQVYTSTALPPNYSNFSLFKSKNIPSN